MSHNFADVIIIGCFIVSMDESFRISITAVSHGDVSLANTVHVRGLVLESSGDEMRRVLCRE